MAADNIFGGRFTLLGQGDDIIGRVVYEAFVGEGTKSSRDRCIADFELPGYIFRPSDLFFGDNVIDRLQIIFQACRQCCGCSHKSS